MYNKISFALYESHPLHNLTDRNVYLVDIETDMCIVKPRLTTSYEQTKN